MCNLTCTGKVPSISSNHTSPSQNRPHFLCVPFHLSSNTMLSLQNKHNQQIDLLDLDTDLLLVTKVRWTMTGRSFSTPALGLPMILQAVVLIANDQESSSSCI